MDSRTRIATGSWTAALAIVATVALTSIAPTFGATRPPNIVFIIADDLGYRELGCYGQQKIHTPNIDALAKQGMRLTHHYCGAPVCAPSRCVLMTGKHGGHAWVRDNSEHQPEGQNPIPDAEVTIAEVLSTRGYVCGAFGKWGLGYPGSEGDPLQQGFQRFFGYNCQRHAHSYYPDYLWNDNSRVPLDNHPAIPGHASLAEGEDPHNPASYSKFKGTDYAPDRIQKQAIQFVRQNAERPFFLYYPTIIPHVALHVPDEELQPYLRQGWSETPFTGGGYTPHMTPRAAYAAMITHLDRHVGELMNLLHELGLDENTIVVFTSDNGTTHLDKEVDAEFFESVGELRGLKGSIYEGGIRVPAIVRYPQHVAAGAESNYLCGFEDWMPTLVELTEVANADSSDAPQSSPLPDNIDGQSFAPTLLGQQQAPRSFLYREFNGYGGQQAIWQGPWKAVRVNLHRGQHKTELYNLEADPSESRDVAADHADLVHDLSRLMASQHTPSQVFPMKALDNGEFDD
ncbi:MAG: arylsulfatase [Pirellulaceae bacterium]|nr:arylsulfatase [Planctomycetales bacterium]